MQMEEFTSLVYIMDTSKYLHHGPEHNKVPLVSLRKPVKRTGHVAFHYSEWLYRLESFEKLKNLPSNIMN